MKSTYIIILLERLIKVSGKTLSEICSLTLKCEIRVSLFEMFRVIENRSNVSVAMTSRVLNPPRGTSPPVLHCTLGHAQRAHTRPVGVRHSRALEVIRCHAKLRFYIETGVSHWYTSAVIMPRNERPCIFCRYAQFPVLCNFAKMLHINTISAHISHIS